MKIIVCIKRVPDTTAKIKIQADGKNIEKKELDYTIGPYDEYAVEQAIEIKENASDVEVVIISLGPGSPEKMFRKCLGMGADRAILLTTDDDLLDPWRIAQVLTEKIKEEKADLLLFGIKSIDAENSQVGPMIADQLNIPFISNAINLEMNENKIKAKVEAQGHQILEASLPLAISIGKAEKEPRICSLMQIKKAKKKPIDKIPVSIANPSYNLEKLEYPSEKQAGKIVGQGVEAIPELYRLLSQEAKVL